MNSEVILNQEGQLSNKKLNIHNAWWVLLGL